MALKSALTERFEPTSKQEVSKAEFESRRKSKAESWGDFGDELLRLVDKAFPTLEYKAKEQFALSRYLDQLEPAEVAFGVKQRRPKTIEQFQNHGNQKLRNGHTQIAMFLYQTVSCCKLNSSLNSCQDLLIRK